MPKPSNAYVPRKGAAGKTYTNADGKKVKHYSVGEDDKKKAGSGERPAPIVPGKSFTKTGPTTVSDRTVEPERSRAKEQAFKESRMDFTPAAKRTTGKTYQEQQNEKNMMGSGGAVKPGQRNPSYVESKPAAPETEKPEEPRRTVQYETGTPAFLETPIPALPPMNYLTGDMDKQVQQMYRDHQRQDIREMPDQLYDIGKPFPNTVKPGQMNGSYTKISDKEPDNRPYRERINSLQDDLTEEVRQRQWMEQANAEYSKARADALHELNMEDIWAMPIEDREELRKYVDADVERRARMGASGPIEFYARDKAASEAFAPLEEKYGEQRAKELAEAMEWYLSEKETERVREYGEKLGHGNFAQKVGGNVLSIAANTAGSITGPMGYLDEAIHRTGQYPTLNPNNMGMTPGVYAGAVREATAQDIEGENGNWFRKGLSYAYQGTMSAADSLARLAVAGEAGGLALAGLGQFGSAVSEASARGASPGQAVCYGVTTASVEVLTEKIPMDDWLKIAKGGKQPLTVAVKNAFKQAGVEITTEEISFVADLMLDATIMQGKSGYNQQVRELEAQGYSRTDAENMASKALLWEAFDTLMVSGFSGGASAGAGYAYANWMDARNRNAGQPNAQAEVNPMEPVQQEQPGAARAEQNGQPEVAPVEQGEALGDGAMAEMNARGQQQTVDTQNVIDDTVAMLGQPQQEARPQTARDVEMAADEVVGPGRGTGIDTGTAQQYNGVNQNTEGVTGNGYGEQTAGGGAELQGASGAGLSGGNGAEWVRGVAEKSMSVSGQTPGGMGEGAQMVPGGVQGGQGESNSSVQLRVPGVLRISEDLQGAQNRAGIPTYAVQDTTVNPEGYEQALIDGRNSDTQNGWCVTPKSAQELRDGNVKTFMNENGTVGVGVAPDGDIVAVFKNKNGGPKKALDTMMPIAIEQGGDRLDCYGEGLVNVYSKYGFEPVARVAFNPEYANEGWTPDKGTPYIYMMKHNGDSADVVTENIGKYQRYTSEQLDDLPTFGKNDYDKAMAYRDSLMVKPSAPQVDTGNVYAEDGQVGDKNLSAAETGFSGKQGYYDLLTDENAQRDRAGDVRPMEMPKTDINGGKVSEVTGNVYGSKITTDEMANLMEKPTAKGYFSYVQISNDQASQMAMNTIAAGETWDNAFDSWKSDVDQGKAGAEMSARAAFLLNHFAEIGDKKQWLKTLHYTQMLGTNTAQGLQALRLIRELNPQDKVAFARMTIQRAVTDLTQKYKTAINMEGAEPLLQALEQAETDEQRDVIIEGLQKYVADQVPSTALDKFTALRYTNMLGNLRTMGRNVAGNVAMAAQYRIKDTIAAGMEQIANVLTDGKVKKTKSVTVGKDLMNACRQDFQQFSSIVSDGGKYGDRVSGKNQFMQGVEEKRTIFKTKLVEAYRKGTNWAMNNQYFGDEAFGREGYARALAGYLKANGVKDADLSKVDGKLMDEARAYAIQQAQEATFHDSTALARVLSKLQKDTGVVGQGIIPFVKTPANVLVRGEEFSPLGFINSTVKTIEGIQGKATGAEIIDSWAKTLTGTGLFALGAFLKSQGWIGGGPDDDEDKENFDKMNGNQPYSLNLPWGGSYTMDWLNPTGIPLFMGAQFQNLFSKDYKDITFADLEEVFTSVADPMIQMSMLQGLNDSLDNIKYSGNNLGQFFLNAGVSYLTQGLQNTMLGQIEKSFEKERTYTYVDKDSQVPAWMQKALGKVSQKFPGWDYHQVPYRNGWGEKEEQPTGAGGMAYNMLSPGYYKAGNEDPVNKELQRLNEEEGLSSDIFPGFQVKKMTWTDGDGIEHKDYNMDAREADRFQETAGKTAHTIVSELLKKEEFKALSPGDKERAIKNAYDYAQEKGREEALDGYQVTTSWMQGVDEENAVDKILARSWSGQNRETTFSDKVQKEMDALEASVPEAKGISEKEIPETVTVAGEEELLSLEQRQQYAEVYDKKVNEYCDALVSDPGFQQLSGEGKTEALKKAKEYAADHAKAAVSDFSDVQKGFGRDVAVRIVNDVALKSITDIFGDIDTNTKKGSSNADNIKALDAAYDQVSELPDMQRDKVLGDAESDAAIYFDARGSGVGTWDFIQARDAVNSAPGSGSVDKDTGKPKQTNADKYEAIAGLERMTDDTIDSLMKAWMPDYDPDNGKTDRAELKYDYARKELRLSPSQYAEAYRINGQYSLKNDKKDAWKEMGLSDKTAEALYKLLGGHDNQFNQKLVELYGG